MAIAVLVRTVVFDQSIYRRGGMANRWLAHMTSQFGAHARRYAPERTGELVAGIGTETNQVGVRQIEGIIESTAPHTLYVLRGTTGPIRTDRGWANGIGEGRSWVFVWKTDDKGRRRRTIQRISGYWLGPMAPWGGFDTMFADEVSGQEPNNFLFSAWRATARNHSSIRGAIPPSFVRG